MRVPATRLDATHWQVAGTQLSDPGNWRIAIAAERGALPSATWATAWTVGSPLGVAPAHRARHSQRALEPITTPLALVLAALACALAIWRARARLTVRRPRTA